MFLRRPFAFALLLLLAPLLAHATPVEVPIVPHVSPPAVHVVEAPVAHPVAVEAHAAAPEVAPAAHAEPVEPAEAVPVTMPHVAPTGTPSPDAGAGPAPASTAPSPGSSAAAAAPATVAPPNLDGPPPTADDLFAGGRATLGAVQHAIEAPNLNAIMLAISIGLSFLLRLLLWAKPGLLSDHGVRVACIIVGAVAAGVGGLGMGLGWPDAIKLFLAGGGTLAFDEMLALFGVKPNVAIASAASAAPKPAAG